MTRVILWWFGVGEWDGWLLLSSSSLSGRDEGREVEIVMK